MKPLTKWHIESARPISYQVLRKEASKMACEMIDVQVKDGEKITTMRMSRLQAILRTHADLAMDGDHKSTEIFLTCAFGRHPQPIDSTQVELTAAIGAFMDAVRRTARPEEMRLIVEIMNRLPVTYKPEEPALCEENKP